MHASAKSLSCSRNLFFLRSFRLHSGSPIIKFNGFIDQLTVHLHKNRTHARAPSSALAEIDRCTERAGFKHIHREHTDTAQRHNTRPIPPCQRPISCAHSQRTLLPPFLLQGLRTLQKRISHREISWGNVGKIDSLSPWVCMCCLFHRKDVHGHYSRRQVLSCLSGK